MNNKRDFREETLLNSAEFSLLRSMAGNIGLSKSAYLRYLIIQAGNKFTREQAMRDTETSTDD